MRRSACGIILLPLCFSAPLAGVGYAQQGPGAASSQQTPARTDRPAGNASAPRESRVTESAIDSSIPDDPNVDRMLTPYAGKVRELNNVIGKLDGELRKKGVGGGSIGNFVADALRAQAQARLGRPVLLAVTNTGGLRKNLIEAGDLRSLDIFELLPFENALVVIDLSGEQLRRLIEVVASRDAQSGAIIKYRKDGQKTTVLSAVLGERGSPGKEIDPAATYTIATVDYLVKRGGDYAMLQEGRNLRPLNITLRDAVMDYVKARTAAGQPIKPVLDGRFVREGGDQPEAGDENR